MSKQESDTKSALFDLNGRPPMKEALPMALQHVVASVVAATGACLIVANNAGLSSEDKTLLVQMGLLMTAISSLVQIYPPARKLGARLPIIMGVGFTIPALMSAQFSLPVMLGSQLVAGFSAILFGLFAKQIKVLFPPVVIGSVIFSIGLSLYPTAVKYMAGGYGSPDFGSIQNWLVALFTFSVVILCNHYTKGLIKLAAALVGLIAGYVLAIVLGMVNFSAIGGAGWLAAAGPLHFGLEFNIGACISMVILYIANSLQTIGDINTTTVGGLDREATDEELSGGIISQGITSVVGALFGGLTTCSYSQNAGIVTMNKVVNRFVFALAALILGVAGCIPKLSAAFCTIPKCVLGGATVYVFSIITMTGVRILTSEGFTYRKSTIAGISVAFGVGISQVGGSLAGFPVWFINAFSTFAPVVTAFFAVALNLLLPKDLTPEPVVEEAAGV